jgi:hypothetical protein
LSYRYEKSTGDIVIEGWENGISPSPHKGLANLQNVNISTETGEATNATGAGNAGSNGAGFQYPFPQGNLLEIL